MLIALQIIVGAVFGLSLVFLSFGLMTPLFIGSLVNKPGEKTKSGFHLFTYPEEGKVKIIVRGDRVVRMIMLFADHTFARDGNRDSSAYWQIEDTPGESEDPLADIAWYFRPWATYVYAITGAGFTGIYPFQTVREYPLERTKMHRSEVEGEVDNITLQVREDYSDHLRARQFLYPFRVGRADTKDKVPLNILAVIKAHVVNPHRAAFGTDRWDIQMVNLATNAITNYTRSHNIDATLSATAKSVDALNKAVCAIQSDEDDYGIQIDGVDLIEISPVLSEKDRSELYAEVLAKSKGKATVIDGEARAKALTAVNKANAEGGDTAIETMRAEAMVRAAEAAKGGTIILTAGAVATDPTQAAILAELKKINANK